MIKMQIGLNVRADAIGSQKSNEIVECCLCISNMNCSRVEK